MKREIRNGLVFAGLILAAAFLTRNETGVIQNPELGERLVGILVGAFFVVTGNAMPKMLKPLTAKQCDPVKTQNFQRFSGWTWVMTGLTYAMVWIALPLDLAESAGVMVMMAGMLIVAARLFQLWRTRRREA